MKRAVIIYFLLCLVNITFGQANYLTITNFITIQITNDYAVGFLDKIETFYNNRMSILIGVLGIGVTLLIGITAIIVYIGNIVYPKELKKKLKEQEIKINRLNKDIDNKIQFNMFKNSLDKHLFEKEKIISNVLLYSLNIRENEYIEVIIEEYKKCIKEEIAIVDSNFEIIKKDRLDGRIATYNSNYDIYDSLQINRIVYSLGYNYKELQKDILSLNKELDNKIREFSDFQGTPFNLNKADIHFPGRE